MTENQDIAARLSVLSNELLEADTLLFGSVQKQPDFPLALQRLLHIRNCFQDVICSGQLTNNISRFQYFNLMFRLEAVYRSLSYCYNMLGMPKDANACRASAIFFKGKFASYVAPGTVFGNLQDKDEQPKFLKPSTKQN